MAASIQSKEQAWLVAHVEGIVFLIEQDNGTFVRRANVPKCKIVTFYNPKDKVK